MKLKLILISACLAAGIAASIALAGPPKPADGTTTGTTATTTGDHHGKGDDGQDCKGVEIRGTVSGGSLTVAVTKADPKAGVGSSATFAVAGPVKVHGRLCGTTLTLQSLEVRPARPAPAPGTTTTTSTTP
jgi:hypothetical protein